MSGIDTFSGSIEGDVLEINPDAIQAPDTLVIGMTLRERLLAFKRVVIDVDGERHEFSADSLIRLLEGYEGSRDEKLYDAGFDDGVRQSPEWAELQSRLAEAERSAAMYKRIAEDQKQRNRDMRNTVNAVTGADAESRWHRLFGTPERTARTLANIATADGCEDCALLDATCCRNEDAWLEWLRGDA